jgi:four helix bundle protein
MIRSISPDKMAANNFKDTKVYKLAYEQAMEFFKLSKNFPSEEKFALTDQVRRSSRSVCTNIAEAYRKKKYPAHFVLKITDSDAENTETNVWLDFSKDCSYLVSCLPIVYCLLPIAYCHFTHNPLLLRQLKIDHD